MKTRRFFAWPKSAAYQILFLVIAVQLLGLVFGALAYDLKFGTNDDSAMALIWRGQVNAVPADQPRLIFISTFIGEILNKLLFWFPEFDSYSAFQQFCVLVSSTVISATMLAYRRDWVGLIIVLAFVLIYPTYFIRSIQFTQTSIILIAAGVSLLFFAAMAERKHLVLWVFSCALMVVGGLVRDVNYQLILLLTFSLAAILFALHYVKIGSSFSSNRNGLVRASLVLAIGIIAAMALIQLKSIEQEKYYSDVNWQEFARSGIYRSNIQHNYPLGFSRNALNEKVAAQTQLSANDVNLLRSWLIADTALERSQNLKKVSDTFAEMGRETDGRSLVRVTEEISDWLSRNHEVWLALFILPFGAFLVAAALLANGFRSHALAAFVVGVAGLLFYTCLLVALGLMFRLPPSRVFVPLAGLIFVMTSLAGLYASRKHPVLKFDVPKSLIRWQRVKINRHWVKSWQSLRTDFSRQAVLDKGAKLKQEFDLSGSWKALRQWLKLGSKRVFLGVSKFLQSNSFSKGVSLVLMVVVIGSTATAASRIYSVRDGVSNSFRQRGCNTSDKFLQWMKPLQDQKILMLPGLVHSHCYVIPYSIKYPDVLTRRGVIFGWMGYTPWFRQRLFEYDNSIYGVLCDEPGAAMYTLTGYRDTFKLYMSERGLPKADRKFDYQEKELAGLIFYRITCRSK